MNEIKTNIAIIGGGALGITLAFWLSKISKIDIDVVLIDENKELVSGTSGTNSFMLQSPLFYDPDSYQKVFGHAVCSSRKFWYKFSDKAQIKKIGTLEIAVQEEMLKVIETHYKWNSFYCPDEKFKMVSKNEIASLEPNLSSFGGLLLEDDATVDYRSVLQNMVEKIKNIKILKNELVLKINEKNDGVEVFSENYKILADFAVNATGPGALKLAHKMGLGKNLADIYVGSYYWKTEPMFNHHVFAISKTSSPKFPYLYPYLSVLYDGTREIGPKPFLVGQPYYRKYGDGWELVRHLFSPPIRPKLKLLFDKEFFNIIAKAGASLVSESYIIEKAKEFIPNLKLLNQKRLAGKRSIIIGEKGFIEPSKMIKTNRTLHVLQYYEPGVTGTPAFAHALARLILVWLGIKEIETDEIEPIPLNEIDPLLVKMNI